VVAQGRVLWVGGASEPWRALCRVARALRCEPLQVPSLEAAGPELARLRPSLVLLHWLQVRDARAGALRARLGALGVPVALVVEADTPVEVLEAGEAEGVEDCLLAPPRVGELRERLAVLRGEPVSASGRVPLAARHGPRVVLMAGASGPRAWGGLGALLESCGHHLLYCTHVEGTAARLGELGVAPHLVLVSGEGPLAALRLLASLRAHPLLEGVPTLTIALGTRAPGLAALLPRIHALLGRDVSSLRVEERVPFCCPVEFGDGGACEAGWTSGFSSTLSPGGLVVRTLVPAPPGTALRLRILLPTTRDLLEAHGVVVWANPYAPRGPRAYPYGMGVRFLDGGSPRLMHLRQLCQGVASP
jgi:uncharacterized protein (TIGR02266 family)